MVKLKEIPRKAAFAWSPDGREPLIASATASALVDLNESTSACLELWSPDFLNRSSESYAVKPKISADLSSQAHDIAWGYVNETYPRGLIALGLDSGALDLWDAEKLIDGNVASARLEEAKTANAHNAPIKSLQFNPLQSDLLATAGSKNKIFIWDLKKLGSEPYNPGASPRNDDINALGWNRQAKHILATGGDSGFTSIWDLRHKKEVLHLHYQKGGVSSLSWHPDAAHSTKIATALNDDSNPAILIWDLRNANVPEYILNGHEKGVLSIDWCLKDSGLLLSCGRDTRTLLWNPIKGELLGEYSRDANWSFQTKWNPTNPEIFATASYDGVISIQDIQDTKATDLKEAALQKPEGADFWNSSSYSTSSISTYSLQQAPKWLKRPVSVSFGFGGQLLSVVNERSERDGSITSHVKLSKVNINDAVSEEAAKLAQTLKENNIDSLIESHITDEAALDDWTVLKAIRQAKDKRGVAKIIGIKEESNGVAAVDKSTTTTTDADKKKDETEESPFGKDDTDDFLNSLSQPKPSEPSTSAGNGTFFTPKGPFSLNSLTQSKTDKAITNAIIGGQYSTAVDLCLQEDRLSDAFMLAILGGDECKTKVEQYYFSKNSEKTVYVRLLASIVGKNLSDVAKNVDIFSWKEALTTFCTFSSDDDQFDEFASTLGDRLIDEAEKSTSAEERKKSRQAAAVCYLAGARLDRLAPLWIDELEETEEKAAQEAKNEGEETTRFAIHFNSLQSLIEKVTIFREIAEFTDEERTKQDLSNWSLSPLYEAYLEYANILASSGQLDLAQNYLDLLPEKYPLATIEKQRIIKAQASAKPAKGGAPAHGVTRGTAAGTATTTSRYPPAPVPVAPVTSSYGTGAGYGYGGAPVGLPPVPGATDQRPLSRPGPYAPAAQQQQQQGPGFGGGAIPQPPQVASSYLPGFPNQQPAGASPSAIRSPPPPVGPPPTSFKSNGGWNDLPLDAMSNRPKPRTPAAVASPFGNERPGSSQGYPPPQQVPGSVSAPPPPPIRTPSMGMPVRQLQQAPLPPPPTNAKPPQYFKDHAVPVAEGVPVQNEQSSRQVSPLPVTTPGTGTPPVNPYAPPVDAAGFRRGSSAAASISPYSAAAPAPAPAPAPARPASASRYAPQQPAVNSSAPIGPPSGIQPPPPAPPPAAGGNYGGVGIPPPPVRGASNAVPPPPKSVGTPPAAGVVSKYPAGDRSHIPASSVSIYKILESEFKRVSAILEPTLNDKQKRVVTDTEKRLNILFDHLNNDNLLSNDTKQHLNELANGLKSKDFSIASQAHLYILTTHDDECGQWMVGVKRLIGMCQVSS